MSRYGETCWIEIPVKNAPRAISFYRKVFDWDIHEEGYDQQMEGIERVYFFSKGNLHGSFLLVPEDEFFDMSKTFSRTSDSGNTEGGEKDKRLWGVVNTFAVEDMDDTLKTILESGGKIFRKKSLLGRDMGSLAKFVDTEGNVFSLFSVQMRD